MTAALPVSVLLLDVNETLSDMRPLADRLVSVGAPEHLLDTWFAATLREGFGLTASGAYETFATVARGVLVALLYTVSGLTLPPHEAAQAVVDGLGELPLHPDVAPALTRLREAGVRVVTLTNGAAENTRGLLERAGVADLVDDCLSVAEVGKWKPAREAYHHAARRCNVPPGELMLVAVHPWDVAGARRAGLRGAWINRSGGTYPEHLDRPDAAYSSLEELAANVVGR